MPKLESHTRLLYTLKNWIIKLRYLLSIGFFFIYMLFFDQYRLPVAWSIYSDVKKMEAEKLEYQKLISKLREDKRDFENNYEKFAREKYFMSRSDEDVFIIKQNSPKNNQTWQF
ncbi:MAG: hypothetical protein IPM34_07185 [Saprospiraceae bacterium]|nr:hypothetical protein [Saprospiraceae bacterium]